jgi:hypothetical protein
MLEVSGEILIKDLISAAKTDFPVEIASKIESEKFDGVFSSTQYPSDRA